MTFLPEKYKIPSTSNYMKLTEGKNQFRVLSSAVVGFEYWNTANKPVRSRDMFEEMPSDIKVSKEGTTRINHFWAFIVWNYEQQRVQILELTQKGIMDTIKEYVENPAWGSPMDYDFIITRKGAGFDTEYSVTVNPKSPAPQVNMEVVGKINLDALFDGSDPFSSK